MKNGLIVALLAAFGCVGTAHAELVYQENAEIFTQDFENGLSANEKITSGFSVFENINGDTVMGHKNAYGDMRNDSYSISLDLTGWTNVSVSYYAGGVTESGYDFFGFYVEVPGQSGVFTKFRSSGVIQSSVYKFDLSQFDGKVVTLKWGFTSDYGGYRPGVQMDNVSVTGNGYVESKPNPGEGSIQVPVSLPLLGVMGFGLMGLARRRSVATK